MCEKELETEQNCNILTPTLMAIGVSFLFSWVAQPGAWGPASLGARFLYRILSSTGLIPNWLNFLCTELYNRSTSTFFLWASQIALIQPIHGQGYTLLFLDRMHLLFTQVHFLFWDLGRVIGQYTTLDWVLSMGQIELNCVLMLKGIAWNRTVWHVNCVLILNWIVWNGIVSVC